MLALDYKELLTNHLLTYRGRSALYLALSAMNVGPGDEVIVQAYTCKAVPEGVCATGASVVFCDISYKTLFPEARELEKLITERTKAIVIQYTFGLIGPSETLISAAKARGIPIIEDCCHIDLRRVNDKRIGRKGAASFFSFEWGKPLVGGLGGCLVFNDADYKKKAVETYGGWEQPTNKIQMYLSYLGFKVFGVSHSSKILTLIKNFGFKFGLLSSNHTAKKWEPFDFKNRMATFFLFMAKQASKKRVKPLCELDKDLLLEFLPSGVKLDELTFRIPILVNNKAVAMKIATDLNLDCREWYTSPVHPVSSLRDLSKYEYNVEHCRGAQKVSKHLVHVPAPETQKMVVKINLFLSTLKANV